MNRNAVTFFGMMLVVAFFAGQVSLLVNTAFGLGLIYVGGLYLAKILKNIDENKKKSPGARFEWSMVKEEMRPNKLSPDLMNAENQIKELLWAHGDNSTTLNQRFAYFLGLSDKQSTPLPSYYSNIINKKLLFEYWKKYGSMRSAVFSTNRLTVDEAMAPIAPGQLREFEQFCLKHG